MKKIYLYVVALSLVFAGCNSDTLNEDNIIPKTTNMIKTQSSLADLITEISGSCKDIDVKDLESLIPMVEQEAFKNKEFRKLTVEGYSTPTTNDLEYISITSKKRIINEMAYSSLVKNYLHAMIIDQQKFSENFFEKPFLSDEEKQLLETCRLFNNHDDDDDRVSDKKPIAFAYGYQTSEANGVFMAVIMSLL